MYNRAMNWLLRASAWLLVLLVLSVFGPVFNSAYAQDTLPQTPPELRDFKLEPASPRSDTPPPDEPLIVIPQRKAPEIRPAPQLPVAVPLIPVPASSDAQPTPTQQDITGKARAIVRTKQTVRQDTEQTRSPTDGLSAVAGTLPEASNDNIAPRSQATTPENKIKQSSLNWWWLASLLLAGAIMVLVLIWRRSSAQQMEIASGRCVVETENPDTTTFLEPPIPNEQPAPFIALRPVMEIIFTPQTATVGFNNLTICGVIDIVNSGKAPAKNMYFRTDLISASAEQDQSIAAFNAQSVMPAGEALGNARPGERLELTITLSTPLKELESYILGSRRLFAPIVVANLEYEWGENASHDRASFACIIGREAIPLKAKMGPLRLDLGPRSFASLGQRPLFTA